MPLRRWLEAIVPPRRRLPVSFGLLTGAVSLTALVIPGRGAQPWEFPGVAPAADSTQAQWLVEALDHRWARTLGVPSTVASWVPSQYAAYARLFHPVPRAWVAGEDGTPLPPDPPTLRWADVAQWSGHTLGAGSDFRQLATPRQGRTPTPADLRIAAPSGEPPPELLRALATVLRDHTTTPDASWFALWDGYGDLGVGPRDGPPRLRLPGRSYLLYTGPVTAAVAFATPGAPHAPTLWWPVDRAWFVGGDVDLDSTYVGGSEALIEQLLRHPDIEAVPVSPRQSTASEPE